MKRFFKLFFIAIFSLLVFVSCGETSVPTQPTQGGNEHQHEFTEDKWFRDSAVHWKECANCDELVDMAEHEYTDYTQSETKCERTRSCTTCGFSQTQKNVHYYVDGKCRSCGKIDPSSQVFTNIKAPEPMKVYVKAPSNWKDLTCYYWQDDKQGDPGDGSEIEFSEQVQMWPGYSMTLVDAENNIWGFKIPKGTNMIIFSNNGAPQSVDIKLANTNYYVLGDQPEDGKYTVWEYSNYEDNSGLTLNQYPSADVKPEYEMITVYAQFPADWEGHNICFWETALGPWPNSEAMTLVNVEKHIYSFEIPNIVTELQFLESENGMKTETVRKVYGLDAYVITVTDGVVIVEAGTYSDGSIRIMR